MSLWSTTAPFIYITVKFEVNGSSTPKCTLIVANCRPGKETPKKWRMSIE